MGMSNAPDQQTAVEYVKPTCPKCGGRVTVYKTIHYSEDVTIRGLRCDCGWRGKHTEDRSGDRGSGDRV